MKEEVRGPKKRKWADKQQKDMTREKLQLVRKNTNSNIKLAREFRRIKMHTNLSDDSDQ